MEKLSKDLKVNLESISEKKLPVSTVEEVIGKENEKHDMKARDEKQALILQILTKHVLTITLNHTQTLKEEEKSLYQILGRKHQLELEIDNMKYDLRLFEYEHGFTVGKLQGNNLGLSEGLKKKEAELEMIKTEIKKLVLKDIDKIEKEVGLQTYQSKPAEAASKSEVERALKASEDEATKKVYKKQKTTTEDVKGVEIISLRRQHLGKPLKRQPRRRLLKRQP